MTPPLLTLQDLRLKMPVGSTVRYLDTTICGYRTRRKSVTGEVIAIGNGDNGRFVVRVKLKDGLLDTIHDNLTLVRKPKP